MMAEELRGRIAEFHRVIEGLLEAGVPIEIQGVRGKRRLRQLLYEFERTLSQSDNRGTQTPEQVLAASTLPSTYRESLLAWLADCHATESLEVLSCSASANDRLASEFRLVWFRIVIVLGLAVLAGSFVVRHSIPAIIQMYEHHGIGSGKVLRIAGGISENWLLTLVIVVSVFALGWIAISRWTTQWRWSGLSLFSPVPARSLRAVKGQMQARLELQRIVAAESRSNGSERRLESVASSSPDTATVEASPLSQGRDATQSPYGVPSVSDRTQQALLNWAVRSSGSEEEMMQRVQGTAFFYQQLAAFHERQFGKRLLHILTMVVGGLAVVCIGIALIQPLSELLLFVSEDVGSVQ